jgi:hypothetical protein
MTEEDNRLVISAAMLGVQFRFENRYWRRSTNEEGGSHTIGRAAMLALYELGGVTEDEKTSYIRDTNWVNKTLPADATIERRPR